AACRTQRAGLPRHRRSIAVVPAQRGRGVLSDAPPRLAFALCQRNRTANGRSIIPLTIWLSAPSGARLHGLPGHTGGTPIVECCIAFISTDAPTRSHSKS